MGRLDITVKRAVSQYPGDVDKQIRVIASTLDGVLSSPEVKKTIHFSEIDLSSIFPNSVLRKQYFTYIDNQYCWWLFHSDSMGNLSYYGFEHVDEPDSELLWSDLQNGSDDEKDFLQTLRMIAGFNKSARKAAGWTTL